MRRGNRSEDIRVEISSCIVASERREKDENTRGGHDRLSRKRRETDICRAARDLLVRDRADPSPFPRGSAARVREIHA